MKLGSFSVGAIALILAACSQLEEPEPTPVYVTPKYDKLGAPSCPAGTELTTVEAGRTVCNPAAS